MTYLCRTRPSMAGTSQRTFMTDSNRGAWWGIQIGPTSGFTFNTTYMGKKNNVAREPTLQQVPPIVTYLCRTRPSMASTSQRTFSDGEKRGCRCPDLGPNLLISGSVSHALWVGDVGHDTAHWEGFGRIPPQGVPKADREETSERMGRSMDLSPTGGHYGGGVIS